MVARAISVGTRARRRRLRTVMVPVFASAWVSAGTCRLGSVKAVLTVSSRWLALGFLLRQPWWCCRAARGLPRRRACWSG